MALVQQVQNYFSLQETENILPNKNDPRLKNKIRNIPLVTQHTEQRHLRRLADFINCRVSRTL